MNKNESMNVSQAISQSERWLDALVPEYVQIDSRDISDLIRFTAEFSTQINYYDHNNKLAGTWEDFFISDTYLLTILVSRLDLSGNIKKFNHHLDKIKMAGSAKERKDSLQELLDFLTKLWSQFSLCYQKFMQTNDPKRVEDILMSIRDAQDELHDLKQFYIEATKEFGDFEYNHELPDIDFNNETHSRYLYFTGSTNEEKILNALTELIKLFNKLNAKFTHLVDTSKNYISKNPINEQSYLPQVGVFIAFLNLYGHLQKKINGLNRKHLDFYFKELLALQLNGGSPDKVHVIIEPDGTLKNLQITGNDLLLAAMPGKEVAVTYRLESDIILNLAQIAEIKTILMSRSVQIVSNTPMQQDVIDTQVYQATHPLFIPAVYAKNPGAFDNWAALGEDQRELAGNMRTMQDAELGLVIGSPLFYLPEGNRTIKLKIHLKPESFDFLVDYILNFSALSRKKNETAVHDLLSNAFKIAYTSTENWVIAQNYSVRCDTENKKDRILEITVRLSVTAPSFDIYRQEIHQLALESELPMLSLGLNNFAEYNPFSFFGNSFIERITFTADVKEFKSVKLQNSIGPLSAASPFQIFGPTPALGSFLDIKNSNVFNRFTKDFSIHLEWLNLPREEGGFSTYYKGYPAPFADTSYEIGISSMNRGNYLPELKGQQKKKLFTLQNDGDYLEDKTNISDIDFSKIKFLNRPRLSDESITDLTLPDGAIRLELSSPPEAFGHVLFPQIFPDAVMEHAKKSKHKKPLPNPPIIPVVKSISVDYLLEYSETFNESNISSNNNVELFHIHPFGYEAIYPGNDKKNISFMPHFEDEGNLLIGLKNVQAGTELSLLFQLENRSFHHTLHESDTIKWSYLDSNNWVSFSKKKVLSDSTDDFISSGIVKLKLPVELPSGNTILNPDLLWIRASTEINDGISPRILGISVNGVTAVRTSGPLAEDESDLRIAPGSIKSFTRTIKGIEQVWQLFNSFNGRPPEGTDKYYVRVSERLRHKQRPVQIRDIIQVVLEKFPEILIAKCFNTADKSLMVTPGANLQLILIPKRIKNSGVVDEQPQVSLATLYKVKKFLSEIISPFVTIEVGNPVYEKVKIICKVLFSEKAAVTSGSHIQQLTNDINRHIAPWLFKDNEDVMIGNRIYKSDILMFIKTRPYVEYVSSFSVVHFFDSKNITTNELNAVATDTAVDEEDYITCSSPGSVLIPSSNHIITLLEEPVFEQAKSSGIGRFIIGDELLVSDSAKINKVKHKYKKTESLDDDEQFSLIITHNI